MAAKPIIDVLLEVRDIARVDAYQGQMQRLGYDPRGEYGLPRRRYFPKTVEGKRVVHVHSWEKGDPEILRHLAFRDYLIAHPLEAAAYGSLKTELVRQYGGDNEAYIAGKHDFCVQMEGEAVAWQAGISAQVLESERLRLVPLSAAQLEFLLKRPRQLEAALGAQVSRQVADPPVVRHAIRLKKYRIMHAAEEEFPWHTYWLAIIRAARFGAGLIGFKGAPDKQGEVEIGYGIDPDFRRKGYTTEAAGMLIAWALRQPTCMAVTAWSDKDNRASARVLEKVGMRMSKVTEDQFCWVKGK
jgi:RimJ/RimL family protein N-acetyltransferase